MPKLSNTRFNADIACAAMQVKRMLCSHTSGVEKLIMEANFMLPVLIPRVVALLRGVAVAVKVGNEIYKKGERDGYVRCSREYEEKLRRQADLFFQTANKWKTEKAEYDALLDEYKKTIEELEKQIAVTNSNEYKQRLSNVKKYQRKLSNLAS